MAENYMRIKWRGTKMDENKSAFLFLVWVGYEQKALGRERSESPVVFG